MVAVASSPSLTKLRRRVRLENTAGKVAGWLIVAGLAFWILANIVKSPSQFFAAFLTGVNNGALYALIALGYTMVYGIIELINFAHGDLFMLGTVVSANVFVNWLGLGDLGASGLAGLLLSMIVAMITCALINVGTEVIAYRRLRNAPKLAPLITAVGFSFIFQDIGINANGSAPKNWPIKTDLGGPSWNGFQLYQLLLVLAVTAPLLLLMTWIVTRTNQGKAMRAVASDQDGARLMGINVNRTISFVFALGGALAGSAGALWIATHASNSYNLGLRLGLIAFTAAVLGGIGNLVGAVLGGLLIGVIEAVNNGAAYGLGQAWSQTVIFAILITLMVFKPEGLLGSRTTEKV
jgi:branched-chain amino acid transport system permease protein